MWTQQPQWLFEGWLNPKYTACLEKDRWMQTSCPLSPTWGRIGRLIYLGTMWQCRGTHSQSISLCHQHLILCASHTVCWFTKYGILSGTVCCIIWPHVDITYQSCCEHAPPLLVNNGAFQRWSLHTKSVLHVYLWNDPIRCFGTFLNSQTLAVSQLVFICVAGIKSKMRNK